jgi:lipopolysaccharide/colanic/teichoic acid biosynthesis glycosyltransferase
MKAHHKTLKRILDVALSLLTLLVIWWLLLILIVLATIDTNQFGLFVQTRVGCKAKLFKMYKIRTMKKVLNLNTTVTTLKDKRITKFGRFLRNYKLDELPQLINVFFGQMSFVGPRPDVIGFADQLKGEDKIILSVKPGITGPASIFFKNEEELLATQDDPEKYNKIIIWPQKVKLNKDYIKNYSIFKDIYYIYKTIIS